MNYRVLFYCHLLYPEISQVDSYHQIIKKNQFSADQDLDKGE